MLKDPRYQATNISKQIMSALLAIIWHHQIADWSARTATGLVTYRSAQSDAVSPAHVSNRRAIRSATRSTAKPSVLATRVSVWTVTSASVSFLQLPNSFKVPAYTIDNNDRATSLNLVLAKYRTYCRVISMSIWDKYYRCKWVREQERWLRA